MRKLCENEIWFQFQNVQRSRMMIVVQDCKFCCCDFPSEQIIAQLPAGEKSFMPACALWNGAGTGVSNWIWIQVSISRNMIVVATGVCDIGFIFISFTSGLARFRRICVYDHQFISVIFAHRQTTQNHQVWPKKWLSNQEKPWRFRFLPVLSICCLKVEKDVSAAQSIFRFPEGNDTVWMVGTEPTTLDSGLQTPNHITPTNFVNGELCSPMPGCQLLNNWESEWIWINK